MKKQLWCWLVRLLALLAFFGSIGAMEPGEFQQHPAVKKVCVRDGVTLRIICPTNGIDRQLRFSNAEVALYFAQLKLRGNPSGAVCVYRVPTVTHGAINALYGILVLGSAGARFAYVSHLDRSIFPDLLNLLHEIFPEDELALSALRSFMRVRINPSQRDDDSVCAISAAASPEQRAESSGAPRKKRKISLSNCSLVSSQELKVAIVGKNADREDIMLPGSVMSLFRSLDTADRRVDAYQNGVTCRVDTVPTGIGNLFKAVLEAERYGDFWRTCKSVSPQHIETLEQLLDFFHCVKQTRWLQAVRRDCTWKDFDEGLVPAADYVSQTALPLVRSTDDMH